jgi:non-ribosomal peptide synthetase component F
MKPTAPFGVLDVHADASGIDEASVKLDPVLAHQVRRQARRASASPARLFHAACALVVAHASGSDDVVFGPVILAGNLRSAGAPGRVGMLVNTLPLRLELGGLTAPGLVGHTHQRLRELLRHEFASVALAQRCSGIAGSAPLFTVVFNFRRSLPGAHTEVAQDAGVRLLFRGRAWTSYPIALNVDDLGEDFVLTAQVDRRIDARLIVGRLEGAIESLVAALEKEPERLALDLSTAPRKQLRDRELQPLDTRY